jgi:aminomethyltransferase
VHMTTDTSGLQGPSCGCGVAHASLRSTPLRDFHIRHGARLVGFSGWEMPVQYRSILDEHRAIRSAAGLFDVSHMGEVDIVGPDAGRFLNRCITNDIAKLYPGRVLYTPMCYPDGGVVDDILVYMRGSEDFFLCVNASNTAKDLAWLRTLAEDFDVEICDRSADYGLLALQGPNAAAILRSLSLPDIDLIKYYHFGEGHVAGVQCLISRTGYTGEDGFELYHWGNDATALAESIVSAGAGHGLVLAGLGARDGLRLEAGYPLYGHELSEEISPIAAGLGWAVKFNKKEDFIGKEALVRETQLGPRQRVMHFRTGGRRIARAGSEIRLADGREAGRVLSGTLSPILGEAIGSALIDSSLEGSRFFIESRGSIEPVAVVQPPFVALPPKL